MLLIIEGYHQNACPRILDQMFRQRKAVFYDKKGWDVPVQGDWEIDQFDGPSTLYLLSVDAAGGLCGSVRLISTASDHMHGSVFAGWFGDINLRHPLIWEATRFCIQSDQIGSRQARIAAKELLLGIYEIGLSNGWEQILAVYELAVDTIYKRSGVTMDPVAEAMSPHGPVRLGLGDVTQAHVDQIRAKTGIATLEKRRHLTDRAEPQQIPSAA